MPDQIVAKAAEMARQESKRSPTPKEIHAKHKCVAQLDCLLIDYFWKEINPLLSQPIHSRLR